MLKRRLLLMLIVAAMTVLATAGSSHARPRDPDRLATTLTASPNPVLAWSQYTVNGCGFAGGTQVNIVINGGVFFATAVDADGCTSFSWWADAAGTVYDIKAYQQLNGGRHQTLMAQTTLTVG